MDKYLGNVLYDSMNECLQLGKSFAMFMPKCDIPSSVIKCGWQRKIPALNGGLNRQDPPGLIADRIYPLSVGSHLNADNQRGQQLCCCNQQRWGLRQ